MDFHSYFPEQFDDKEWIRNPFSDVVLPADFSVQERDQFVELSCDGGLKNKFKKDMLCDFWVKRRAEYILISNKALHFLIPFSTSYLCEADFSVQERDQFVELSCDGGLKNEFKKDMLCDFWLKRRAEYALISNKALHFLMPFSTSYLCETGFSAMLAIKNKY